MDHDRGADKVESWERTPFMRSSRPQWKLLALRLAFVFFVKAGDAYSTCIIQWADPTSAEPIHELRIANAAYHAATSV
jgi:hypothetical protein